MAVNEKFVIGVELEPKNIKTLFNESWRYFTVPSAVRKDWRDNEGTGRYMFSVADDLLAKYENQSDIWHILNSIRENCVDSSLTITYNSGTLELDKDFREKYSHYRCQVSVLLLQKLKTLFISSYVFAASQMAAPKSESMKLSFNHSNHTVELIDIILYNPDDPYLKFARHAAERTSFNSVFESENLKNSNIANFYKDTKPWMPKSDLDEIEKRLGKGGGDIYNAIYMLYDENSQTFYVGKADALLVRLRGHQSKTNLTEPIPEFTHFRYSTINDGYEDYIYIIENSAIHDCAWIYDMPKASHYKPSLSSLISSKKIKGNMECIKMVNTMERQTRSRNKKVE